MAARQAERSAEGGARSARRGSPARSAEPLSEAGGRAGAEAGLGRQSAQAGRGADREGSSRMAAEMPEQQAAAGREPAPPAKIPILKKETGKYNKIKDFATSPYRGGRDKGYWTKKKERLQKQSL